MEQPRGFYFPPFPSFQAELSLSHPPPTFIPKIKSGLKIPCESLSILPHFTFYKVNGKEQEGEKRMFLSKKKEPYLLQIKIILPRNKKKKWEKKDLLSQKQKTRNENSLRMKKA